MLKKDISKISVLSGSRSPNKNFSKSITPELISELEKFVHNISLRYLRNNDDAEEVSQEVLIIIFKKIPSFRNHSTLNTWVYRITVNTCLNYLKKKNRQNHYSYNLCFWEKPSYCNDPETIIEKSDDQKKLLNKISYLPDSQKKALTLSFLKGYKQKKAAKVMKISVKALESLIQRGKQKLKRHLNLF